MSAAGISAPLRWCSSRKTRTSIAAAGGGKLFLFDRGLREWSGRDAAPSYGPADADAGALASWLDAQGVRWIAVPAPRGIVAMKVVEQGRQADARARVDVP